MPNVEEIFQKNLPQIVKFWFGFDEGNRGNKNMILRARPYTAIKAEEEARLSTGHSRASFSFIFGLFQAIINTIFSTSQCEKMPNQ